MEPLGDYWIMRILISLMGQPICRLLLWEVTDILEEPG